MFPGSWLMVYDPGNVPFSVHHEGRRIWGDPRITLKSHQTPSQSSGQQKSWKLVPKPPKTIKNGPWNHEKSNFCESCFLQYLPCQMLGFPIPDTQIQTPKIITKSNLEIHMKKSSFWSKSTRKAIKIRPLNQEKIDKIQAWTSQGPSLCPPMSQGRPRIVPGTSRTPK